MSTPLFLLAASGLALALAASIILIERYVAPPLAATHRRRLERRLSRRLARGHDNYFEELSSIEAGLAPSPARVPLTLGRRAFAAVALFLYSVVLLGNILPEDRRPAWAGRGSSLVLVILGLQMAIGIFGPPDQSRIFRIMGLIMIVLGLLFFWHDLSRYQLGLP